MFTKVRIYPYRMASQSAGALAEALRSLDIDARRVRSSGIYRPRPRHLIVNWGSSDMPNWYTLAAGAAMLNKLPYVRNASEKGRTFELLSSSGCPVVPFTSRRDVAAEWLANRYYGGNLNAVVCRTLTRANSGRGIVLAKTPEELVPAPLYTRYVPKVKEFRVHVFADRGMIDVQEKRKINGFTETEGINKYIRNHPNGWVFCRENVEVPPEVVNVAERAVLALHLDFGAVDLGWHPEYGTYIYEVNTAPGLEGQTLTNYAQTIRSLLV